MVTKTLFGNYELYTISNGILSVSVMNLGATITEIQFMGKNMVLSYSDPEDYLKGTSYICAAIGRFSNRIGGAKFALNGKEIFLTANEGNNQLHSGPNGIDKRLWNAEVIGETVRFSVLSPDGDNGFPGNIKMSLTFSITESSALNIEFSGETDQATVFAPTVHPYFNLGSSCSVLEAEMKINSEHHLEVDDELIPTGNLLPCSGKYDFHSAKKIEKDLDDCFVADDESVLSLEIAGITMKMRTDFPAVQVYTGSSLQHPFMKNEGIAIEPEFFPDAPNHPEFPSCILQPGEKFRKFVQYKFNA